MARHVHVSAALLAAAFLLGPAWPGAAEGGGHYDELGVWVPDAPSVAFLPGPDLGAFRNHAEMAQYLLDLETAYPGLLEVRSIGASVQGRAIWLATLTDESAPGPKVEVLLDGAHHGDEPIGSEHLLRLMRDLVEGFGVDPDLTALVQGHVLYFVPMVNPDGVERVPTCGYYADCRKNANGVDLNRNYGFQWGGAGSDGNPASAIYRGPFAFSEPETRAIRDWLDAHNVAFYVSAHSGAEIILWPWGYTTSPPPEQPFLSEVGSEVSGLTGRPHGQISTALYLASGVSVDHAYGGSLGARGLTYTPEVYQGSGDAFNWWFLFNPPDAQLESEYQSWKPGLLHTIAIAGEFTNVVIDAPDFTATPAPFEFAATLHNLGRRTFTSGVASLQLPPELELVSDPNVNVGTVAANGGAAGAAWTLRALDAGVHEVAVAFSSPLMGTFRASTLVEVEQVAATLAAASDLVGAEETLALDGQISTLGFTAVQGVWRLEVTGDTTEGPYAETVATGSVDEPDNVLLDLDLAFDAAQKPAGAYTATLVFDYEATRPDSSTVAGTASGSAPFLLTRPDLELAKAAPATAAVGETFTVTTSAVNEGDRDAQDLVLTEVVPAGYAVRPRGVISGNPFSQYASPPPNAVLAGLDGSLRLTWRVGALAPGAAFAVSYDLVAAAPGAHALTSTAAYEHDYAGRLVSFTESASVPQTVG